MRVLSFPLRLDGEGAFASVEQWSDIQAQQTAQHIVSTDIGERALAPQFGIPNPIGFGVSEEQVRQAVSLCEPDLEVTDVDIDLTDSRQSVSVAVRWRDDDDLGDY